MSEPQPSMARFISWLAILLLFVGAVITTAMLWWLGNWEAHSFGLVLTLRIVWGCWLVGCLALLLTRVTIFGWYFRRYFRWPQGGEGAPPPQLPPAISRAAKAPWYKSGAASFSITVVLVSLTGAMVVATAVMWILMDVTGEWVFWLVFKVLWATWWVGVIASVLTRVSIFRWHMKKALEEGPPAPVSPPAEVSGGKEEPPEKGMGGLAQT